MKMCTKCRQVKSSSEFYPARGNHAPKCGLKSECKTCQKKRRKIYLQSEQGKATVKRNAKGEATKACQRRYHLRHPNRGKSKNAVYWAIRKGKLPHPKTLKCNRCPAQAEQYHHWSYLPENWLDVEPVCIKCHVGIRTIHDGDTK